MEDAATTEILAWLAYHPQVGELLGAIGRPKALIIESPGVSAREVVVEAGADGIGPRIEATISRIRAGRFIGKGDREVVVGMYRRYSAIIGNALIDARSCVRHGVSDETPEFRGTRDAQGQAEGRGTVRYASGDVYEGELRNGKQHGFGIYKHAGGNVYEGEFRDGRMDGSCTYTYATGGVYKGEWQEQSPHGHGMYTLATGICYEGEFKRGRKEGHGTMTDPGSGCVYVGDFLADVRHGRGKLTFSSHSGSYEGEWANGKQDGSGRYEFEDGTVYSGEWRGGAFNGHGTLAEADGDAYEGEFVAGQRDGRGTFRFASGAVLSGIFHVGDFVREMAAGMSNAERAPLAAYDGGFVSWATWPANAPLFTSYAPSPPT